MPNKPRNFRTVLADYICQQDQFGHPISLTYKRNNTFKTFFGGFITILFRMGIVVFLVFEIMKVVEKKSNIANSQYRRNLVEDKRQYQIDLTNFDLAYSIFSTDPKIAANIDRYVSVQFQEVYFAWSKDGATYTMDVKDVPLDNCPPGRFLGETVQTDNFGIQFNYKCPVTINSTLQGSFATKETRYIQVLVGGCNQAILNKTKPNLQCANDTDIMKALDFLELNLLTSNQFVDVNEKEGNPIKTIIKNFYATSKSEISQSFQIKIGQNFLIKNTSPLSNQLSSENITYYQVRADETALGSYKKYQTLFRYYILLDDNILTTSIEVYTISDALSNTGGILGIVSIIVAVLLSKAQENFFYQSLVGDIFQITNKDAIQKSQNIKQKPSIKIQDMNSSNINLSSHISDASQNNQQYYQRLLVSVKNRIRFFLTDFEIYFSIFACCKKKEQRELIKKRMKLFKKAQEMLDKKLEIFTILRNIQMVKLLKRITLSNYQRKLTPYFKQNLVQIKECKKLNDVMNIKNLKLKDDSIPCLNEENNVEWNSKSKSSRRQIKIYLKHVLMRKDNNKLDKRIFKNLDPEFEKKVKVQVKNPIKDSILKNLNKDLMKVASFPKPKFLMENNQTYLSSSVLNNYLTTNQKKDTQSIEDWDDQSRKIDTYMLSEKQLKVTDEGDYSISQYLEKEINY
ncbi:UNKNOWN [Stylonychia lemnae]|uniref:Uncharacterized protein n=1 Tax=Stylonychia lemnae TaxID=5949 RepID=A0A078AHU4_STYLE|nr:UNKNOWN [Stylonychia lemnae]|eukprot:CDW81840.1 UNKNOWN [Stylonychia lemnae]